jgi:hypothetical protein
MPASKAEQVLDALKTLLETLTDAVVERNSALPEKIPDGGLIILRDGDPGGRQRRPRGRARRLRDHRGSRRQRVLRGLVSRDLGARRRRLAPPDAHLAGSRDRSRELQVGHLPDSRD